MVLVSMCSYLYKKNILKSVIIKTDKAGGMKLCVKSMFL